MSARESLCPEPEPTRVIDRRAFVRLASDLDAVCRAAGTARDFGWPGTVRDISRGGVGLILTHRFQPGTDLAVELRDSLGAVRHIVRARVVHATATSIDGSPCWALGCIFETPLTDVEFEALR